MGRQILTLLLIMFLGAPCVFAQTSDPALLKQKNLLSSRLENLRRNIHGLEQSLHELDRARRDKLEELEQLYAAYRDVNKRFSFSSDIQAEMAVRSTDLHAIEKERSDCLEELDCLYASLSRLNGDIKDCDKALIGGGTKP
jgi:chromosome segregation ATPase